MGLSLKDFMASIRFQEPRQRENLTIYPLLSDGGDRSTSSYRLLEEALKTGQLEIGELGHEGRVNTVVILNKGEEPVLILDGEEIMGAKQNRMINATVLVPAKEKVEVPVSCVERGRWRYSSPAFDKVGSFGYSNLRRQKAQQVHQSLKYDRGFQADQGAIWREIDRKQACMGISSDTDALHAVYENYQKELENFINNLQPASSQSGIAVFINNRFVCLDIFDCSGTLSKLWSKLLKSYALEALEAKREKKATAGADLPGVLQAVAESKYETYPSVGLGHDLRLSGPEIIGAGLVWENRILHLSIFENILDNGQEGGMGGPDQRRRNLW